METSLSQISLPYRGAILSAELSAYLNGLREELEARTIDIERIEDYFSNHFIYGMTVTYQSQVLTVAAGGYFRNGVNTPTPGYTMILNEALEDNTLISINTTTNTLNIGSSLSYNDIVVARYLSGGFDYSVRKKISESVQYTTDRRRVVTIDTKAELGLQGLASDERLVFCKENNLYYVYTGPYTGWLTNGRMAVLYNQPVSIHGLLTGAFLQLDFIIPNSSMLHFNQLIVSLHGNHLNSNSHTSQQFKIKVYPINTEKTVLVPTVQTAIQDYTLDLEGYMDPGKYSITLESTGESALSIEHITIYGVVT